MSTLGLTVQLDLAYLLIVSSLLSVLLFNVILLKRE